ncbi:PBP1A family penicillin-binding protein [Lactobacillus pentosus]|jgi:penicillin-binding protein 1A|uniref:PBP1A family penicillin-binding protein n=1 Tax=Lactiplantibacillus pentosus TaxID=1589 RepID=UPI00128C10B7|nr:PBP1A family penicillin-binding protein [Lactiplantibacillus pentosus]MCH4130650.1 penicillin-binding protein [Lactiplantibacillus sp.]MCT3287815.1 penicillin-binding protein [Lactiplantibacillus pentosus]MCT3292924.1 penicillin-binding protein [Lactiplantibacillus pentosus]MPQ18117.1 PBP1A family penicillin-binding protein [Lactiplantibacillus pentosus]UXI95939.1 penicillin-binding protein [Lactiplantibacillus pentosus]
MAGNNEQNSRVARRKSQPQPPKKHWFRRIFLSLVGLFVVGVLAGLCLFFYYAQTSPTITESDLKGTSAVKIYGKDDNYITNLGTSNLQYVKSSNIPTTLKNAVVSIEDRRFYKHHGVDYYRILGAAVGNLKGSSLGMQGGSTLTMQLVKLAVFSTDTSDRNLKVKAQEAWLALNLEKHYSKSQILEFYINKVYMGNGIYGMGTAAKYYYNKSLKDLSLSQLALLAGMPQSPTYYDPTTYPSYATSRRNLVLEAMYDNKVITKSQETAAKKVNVKTGLSSAGRSGLTTHSKTNKILDAYLNQVRQDLLKKGYKLTDGEKVYTNLDMDAQKRLYEIANTSKYVTYPNNGKQTFQLGVSVVDSYTGKISAMIGGRKIGNVVYGTNRAVQTDRSNASTMKPILDYGPAIEYLNWPTYKSLSDTKYKYPGTNISVHDFDNNYLGNMTMREALVQSRNIPAVRTLQAVGKTRAQTFAKGIGINLKTVNYANAIGAGVSTLQVAGAYAAFADGGVYHKPYYIRKVTTADGKTTSYTSTGKRAMKKSTAYMITDMLKGVINSSTGTATTAKISGVYQAGKTGTDDYDSKYKNSVPSNAVVDSWMAGYTKNYSVAVWTGYDKATEAGGYLDSSNEKISQQIYRAMMSYLQQYSPNSDWTKPSTVGTTKRNGIEELYVVGHLFSSSEASSGTSSSASSSSSVTSSSATSTSSSSSSESSESSSSEESSSSSSASSSSAESSSSEESSESSSTEASSSSAASSEATTETPTTDTNTEGQ